MGRQSNLIGSVGLCVRPRLCRTLTAAAPCSFHAADKNGDGELDREEYGKDLGMVREGEFDQVIGQDGKDTEKMSAHDYTQYHHQQCEMNGLQQHACPTAVRLFTAVSAVYLVC